VEHLYIKQCSPEKAALRRANTKEMSPEDKRKAHYGERAQGDYLIGAKERNSETKQKRPTRL
jgi:hypothetical protein